MTVDHRFTHVCLVRLARRAAYMMCALSAGASAVFLFVAWLVFGRAYGGTALEITACVIGAAIIATGTATYFLARNALRPIGLLTMELNKIAQGDLTVDLSAALHGELGLLVGGIQEMLDAFRVVVEKIIATTITNVVTFGAEFKGLVAHATEGSVAQSNQATAIAAAADQMSGSAEAVRRNTEAVYATAESAMGKARSGAIAASLTAEALSTVGKSTEKLAEHIEESACECQGN